MRPRHPTSVALFCLTTFGLLALPGLAGPVDPAPSQADREALAEIEKRIDRAERLSGKRKLREAEEILDEILASDRLPTSVRRRALTVRASALLEDASAILNDPRPPYERPEEERGRRERVLREAVGDLREIVRVAPDALEAQRALVFTLAELDRHREAVEEIASYMSAAGGEIDSELDRLRRCLVYLGSLPEGQPVGLDDSEILEDLTEPARVRSPMPAYTPAARRAVYQGVVISRLLVDPEGRVVCVKIVRGAPYGLNTRVRDTVHRWRFDPARLDGEPVAAYHYSSIVFKLQ